MRRRWVISLECFIAFIISIIQYILFIFLYGMIDDGILKCTQLIIIVFSWIGIINAVFFISVWKKKTGYVFTLFTIFLLFFIVFNFGQCLLWAFGIHPDNEIGKVLLFSSVKSSPITIVKAQLLFIVSFSFINLGALSIYNNSYFTKLESYQEKQDEELTQYGYKYSALYYASIVVGFFSIPATLLRTWIFSQFVANYGYAALGTSASNSINGAVMNILSSLFMPVLLGMLIGSRHRKGTVFFVYCIFTIYAILSTMSGDRGEWVTRFVVLIWLELTYYRKLTFKGTIKLIITGIIGLWILQAAISLRNKGGITAEALINALTNMEVNPIVSALTEFGHSMAIVMILLTEKITYPFGNTYIMSFLTMLSPGLTNGVLGTKFVEIQDWFPKNILHINYGSDFSMIGEAVLNFGVYFTPIVISILGIIIFKVTYYPYKKQLNPFLFCMTLNLTSLIFKLPRTTIWFLLNYSIYSIIILGGVYWIFASILCRRRNINGKYERKTSKI
mgnify:CR=1 FL=1